MNRKIRIAVLGLGGVGGYLGGLLAKTYAHSETFEIIFIARPESAATIRENGLRVMTLSDDFTVFPDRVISDASDACHLDVLICTVKSYDLEQSLMAIAPLIGPDTLILPLQNGVQNTCTISELFPFAKVLEGCIYIVSRREAPGLIRMSGEGHMLYFGSEIIPYELLVNLNTWLRKAGINSIIPPDIHQTIWEKFVFISVVATMTSSADEPIGALLINEQHRKSIAGLLNEVTAVAKAKGIHLPDDMKEKAIKKMESQPYETTSSMHSDFQKGGLTEFEQLTAYVVEQGIKLGIPTPYYTHMLEILLKKSAFNYNDA